MLHRFHNRFGTAGTVIAVIALVAALSGTAFAASGALTGKQKKEVEKIAKKFQGTGPAGANGRDGANGKDGSNGTNGKDGTSGAAGKSVVLSGTAPTCAEGGASVEVEGTPASKKEVCNGEEGQAGLQGPEGEPWTDGGTLPPGATETGTWAFSGLKNGEEAWVPISFPVPMPFTSNSVVSGDHFHFGEANSGGEFSAGGACPGSFGKPQAAPGELCLYRNAEVSSFENVVFETSMRIPAGFGFNRSGATLVFKATADGGRGLGTFAITGCEPDELEHECAAS